MTPPVLLSPRSVNGVSKRRSLCIRCSLMSSRSGAPGRREPGEASMAEEVRPVVDAAAPSRRDRARVETVQEIKDTARRVLVEHGPDGLALRAIAREMGMTAPGLYR